MRILRLEQCPMALFNWVKMGEGMVTADALPSAKRDMHCVRSPLYGLFASDGTLFKQALFARDAIEGAEDMLAIDGTIAHDVIIALARLQGTNNATPGPMSNEEEIGKIHHEARQRVIDGKNVNAQSEAIITELAARWGGNKDGFVYYGAIDATPLFVRLIARYCKQYGNSILSEEFTNRNGSISTVKDSLIAATTWIDTRIEHSSGGFLEFHRHNPQGILNQAWKDSLTSYIHANGELVNHNMPVAPLEVQGYAYDALNLAAQLLSLSDQTLAMKWRNTAMRLQGKIFNSFWMNDVQYFAIAVDHDPKTNASRQCTPRASNAGALLDTTLFDNLPRDLYQQYVGGIITTVFGKDFLTDAGIRCRSNTAPSGIKYADYQGSRTSWPKETYDLAKGLQYQGFAKLSEALENRLLNVFNLSGRHYEFVYVNKRGSVEYRPLPSTHRKAFAGTNIPENAQTWSITAAYAIKYRHGHKQDQKAYPTSWHAARDTAIANRIPKAHILKTRTTLEEYRSAHPTFGVNTTKGQHKEAQFKAKSNHKPHIYPFHSHQLT